MKNKEKPKYGEPYNPYNIDKYAPAYNCILKSSFSDSDKLLLIKLCQYGGKDGKVFPKRISLATDLGWSTSKLDKTIKSLKGKALITTMKTGCHSSSRYTFLFHEIYDSSSKKEASSTNKVQKKFVLREETIELIEYWNNFDSLTTHRLEGEQSRTVQKLDVAIRKLLHGKYYVEQPDVHVGARNKVFTMDDIKKSIERMAVACGPDYNSGDNLRMTFLKFIHNPRTKIGKGKNKYRYKYPLLHFDVHDPEPLSEKLKRKNTEYEATVHNLIKKLTGSDPVNFPDIEYNKVVKYVEKAALLMEKFRPSDPSATAKHLKWRMSELIYYSLEDCGKGCGVRQLGLAVSHLEEMMKRRLIIQ